MNQDKRLSGVGGFLFQAMKIVLAGLALAVLGSLILGWRSLAQMGTTVLLVGAVCVVIGVLSMVGNWGGTRNFQQQFARTAWEQDAGERMHREVEDTERSYGFAALLGTAGLVLVVIGFVLDALG